MSKIRLNGNEILKVLIENILVSLDELFQIDAPSDFNEGGRYAYLECLEIISKWSRFSKFGINNIEEKYPIK